MIAADGWEKIADDVLEWLSSTRDERRADHAHRRPHRAAGSRRLAAADRPHVRPGGWELPLRLGHRVQKLAGPAVGPADLGRIDAVLLTHDQHEDNLDAQGARSWTAAAWW